MGKGDFGATWHAQQLGKVDDEIARLAFICGIRMLDPGVIERVVNGDSSVCRSYNEKTFKQLRGLVGMHYSLTSDTLQSVGPEELRRILDSIRTRIGKRFDIGGEEDRPAGS